MRTRFVSSSPMIVVARALLVAWRPPPSWPGSW